MKRNWQGILWTGIDWQKMAEVSLEWAHNLLKKVKGEVGRRKQRYCENGVCWSCVVPVSRKSTQRIEKIVIFADPAATLFSTYSTSSTQNFQCQRRWKTTNMVCGPISMEFCWQLHWTRTNIYTCECLHVSWLAILCTRSSAQSRLSNMKSYIKLSAWWDKSNGTGIDQILENNVLPISVLSKRRKINHYVRGFCHS